MNNKCSVCSHPDHQKIDLALVSGDPIRSLVIQYDLGKDSLRRHRKNHIQEKLIASQAVQIAKEGDTIASRQLEVYRRALAVQKKTEAKEDWPNTLLAMDKALKALEPLLASYLELEKQKAEKGQGDGDSDLILRHFMGALHDYPDVKNRLKESLRGNGNGGSLH